MSITINFRADATPVVDAISSVSAKMTELAGSSRESMGAVGGAIVSVREKMQELNDATALWTEAMGVESMLSGLSRIGSMLSGVFSSVGSVFTAAADKEDFAAQLGVMMNSSVDGSALADSLERLATNGVVGMQELQSAAAALIGSFSDPGQIAGWVSKFADISTGSKISATRLAEMVARLDDMGKAEFTELANAGVPIFQALGELGARAGWTPEQPEPATGSANRVP